VRSYATGEFPFGKSDVKIGRDLSALGTLDENLIPVLHRLSRPTFFTHDEDFFKTSLVHASYALVYLDVSDKETAELIRRFLKHPSFRTQSQRLGAGARLRKSGIDYWRKGQHGLQKVGWTRS
jgi:hypothetical protein